MEDASVYHPSVRIWETLMQLFFFWPVLLVVSFDFSSLDSFWSLPPHCVIENPVPCLHTRTVWLSSRASARSSGPTLNSLRLALAECSETENPWLAENNKYPWEAARWTFTVSLAGEGEICQTSHQASAGERSRFTCTMSDKRTALCQD